jgi:hypothetical protein
LLRTIIDAAEAGTAGPSGAAPLERTKKFLHDDQRRWPEPTDPLVRTLAAAGFAAPRG